MKRGDIMAYHKEPGIPLKLLSSPYAWNGQMVVTAKKMAKAKKDQTTGMYVVSGLVPCEKSDGGSPNDHP